MKLSNVRMLLEDRYDRFMSKRVKKSDLNQYSIKGRGINVKHCLTKTEKNQIDNFYLENYGSKVPYLYHEVCKSFNGKFDVRYFPEYIYYAQLQRYVNPESFADVLEDKNFTPIVAEFAGVNMPRSLVYKIKDFYFDSRHQLINEKEALNIILNESSFIIKPTVGTCGGNGIRFVDFETVLDPFELIASLFREYKTNFVVQQVAKCHSSISCLHPESLNTIRIVTYILDGEIYHMPIVLRMGVGENKVDNACAGGILTGVNDDGSLTDLAVNQYCTTQPFTCHPDTKVQFASHKVEHIQDVIEAAVNLHGLLPQIGIIDWDFCIDTYGKPLLIEANVANGGGMRLSQWVHGKGAFGDNTEYVLKWLSEVNKMNKSDRLKNNIYL